MRFVGKHEMAQRFEGKRVALVGSGPGCLSNAPGFVDSHDVVLRVNNFKTGSAQGYRTDVFYSFFGSSIRKTTAELVAGGVKLCMAKCPDAKFIESAWHRRNGKSRGVDFRPIYAERRTWWFCDTYIPQVSDFMSHFNLLGRHVPTTGFAAILDVLACKPASLYLTGFDFFESGVHNVDEAWRAKKNDDPIGHVPARERAWLDVNLNCYPIALDAVLTDMMKTATPRCAPMVFEYRGKLYPEYLKHGNACQFVAPIALQFCRGEGLDIGAGCWPLAGAVPIEIKDGGNAMNLPPGHFDYVFSSHCLEHLVDPVQALEHWKSRLKPGGVLCLYLPHPDMEYWRPQHCRKHLHAWRPEDMAQIVRDLGFKNVIHSERDLAWGFSVVGFNA